MDWIILLAAKGLKMAVMASVSLLMGAVDFVKPCDHHASAQVTRVYMVAGSEISRESVLPCGARVVELIPAARAETAFSPDLLIPHTPIDPSI